MSERTISSYSKWTLLPESDTEKMEPLTSVKDADFRHQKAAMVLGYNSVAELAIDELLPLLQKVADLEQRVAALEGLTLGP